jgi:hypothetical protein
VVSALLLMAPSLAVDLALRGVGLVMFAALLARNRRESEATGPRADASGSA